MQINITKKDALIKKIIAVMLVINLTITNFLLVATETYEVIAESSVATEETTNTAEESAVAIQAKQTVEKYSNIIGEEGQIEGVLLQVAYQLDIINTSNKELSNEQITIQFPKIGEVESEQRNIVDIPVGYKSSSSSTSMTITPNSIVENSIWKIAYIYPGISVTGEETNITVETPTVTFNHEEVEVNSSSEATVTLSNSTSSIISADIIFPDEVYKGAMYNNEQTSYTESWKVQTSYLSANTDNNKISMISTPSQNIDGNNKQISITYSETKIGMNNLKAVFGEEFQITITSLDDNGQALGNSQIITNEYKTEEGSTYAKVQHPEGTKQIKIETSDVKSVANVLEIINTKSINLNGTSDVNEIKSQVNINENLFNGTLILKEPTLNAEVGLKDKTILSAVDGVQNIDIVVTLNTNSAEKDILFDNPIFTISMPEGITINKINNTGITAGTGLSVLSSNLVDGNVNVQLSGKQTQHNTGSEYNPQITINAQIQINKLMANKIDNINMNYKNVNDNTATSTSSANITIKTSNEDIFAYLKAENYNENNVIDKFSDSEQSKTGLLKILDDAKTIKVTGTIINNTNKDITTPVNFKASKNDQDIKTNSISANILKGDIYTFTEQIEIPANLYYNESVDISYTYTNPTTGETEEIALKLATEQKEVGETQVIDNKLLIETVAQLGDGTLLKDGNSVYAEEIVEYTVRIANLTEEEIKGLEVTATQQNGNIYGLKEILVMNPSYYNDTEEHIEYRYDELDTNIQKFNTLNLQAKEVIELKYKIVTKKVNDDITYGNISILSENIFEQIIETAKLTVNNAKLKIKTKLPNSEGFEIGTAGYMIMNTYITNLTNEQLNDVEIKLYLKKNITWDDICKVDIVNLSNDEVIKIDNVIYNEEEKSIKFKLTLDAEEEVLVRSLVYINSIDINQVTDTINFYATAKTEDDIYTSNSVIQEVIQTETKVDIIQETNVKNGETLHSNDEIEFTFKFSNSGSIALDMTLKDEFDEYLTIMEVTVDGEIKELTELNSYGNIFEMFSNVNAGRLHIVIVKAKVIDLIPITKTISNFATVNGIKSNTVEFTIVSNMPDNPDEPDNPDTPDNPDEPTEKTEFTISGTAWIDVNKDGKMDSDEDALKGINVKLVDANNNAFVTDSNGKVLEVTTGEDGTYKFEKLEKGKYFVVFEYDTSLYELTDYKKEGITEDANSDVKDYVLDVNNKANKVAISDEIVLESEDVQNINIGLMNLPKFNLQLDKYVTKLTVRNNSGTEIKTFEGETFVKEEISRRYLVGTNMIVEYTIRITNTGELSGYVTDVVDYIPDGMSFSSELNTSWYKGVDGNLYNTSLASTEIKPGESKDIKLILTKTVTTEDAETITNNAKIDIYTNSKEIIDEDLNNNENKADIIISVATGEIVMQYIYVLMTTVVILGVGIYFIKRKILG